ncbi:MAG: hypothetical protein J6J15_02145 [Oscillospiraceae bacterium]|nr:hypothetical protein [Oscillospiraceae bacterium]MBQ5327968.1 hypothetical protein [Oscillospiraceae bacterium]
MAFKLINHIAELSHGVTYTLNLSMVEMDGKGPYINIGKWHENTHKRFSGNLTLDEAKALYKALGDMLNENK